MKIVIKKLKLRNFMSVGAVEQTIDFNTSDLTLILGENLDLGGGDSGARNGVGKTVLIQGLSYALFGTAINAIKRDNLINRTNEKNMSADIEFSMGDVDYRIIRSRKPNSLKFYIDNREQAIEDDSQGDSRETQDRIERVLGMSSTMFQHIVGLNSYTTPFLSMKVSDQREVIEQLLGITLLSEKAELLKELNRKVKDEIQREQMRLHAIEQSNLRINEQIAALVRRQTLWTTKRDTDLAALAEQYAKLAELNIEAELAAHCDLSNWQIANTNYLNYCAALQRSTQWQTKNSQETAQLLTQLESLGKIDFDAEILAHKNLVVWSEQTKQVADQITKIATLERDISKEQKNHDKLESEIDSLMKHRCYACGQELHDQKHEEVLANKHAALAESKTAIEQFQNQLSELKNNVITPIDRPVTHFKTESEAVKQQSMLESLMKSIKERNNIVNPHSEQVAALACSEPGIKPVTHYDTQKQAIEHASKMTSVIEQIETKSAEIDPYVDQIAEMRNTAIQEVDYSAANELTKLLQHQEYLLDLLTNKKSFVRKRIIEQNLGYLNGRLSHYLDRIGLPHRVIFQNDLSVEITELGRELDYHNLSRGEANRVILALSFAFRDVYENLYHSTNLLFIDELVDNGMDAVGLDNALGLLKEFVRKRNKSVWIVSHKDELVSRVDNVMHVIKENGFTSFKMNDE